jgi:hypothetical protein
MAISQSLFSDVCSRSHGLKLIVLGTSRNYTKSKFRVSPCDGMRMEWRQGCCPSSPILASPAASAAPGMFSHLSMQLEKRQVQIDEEEEADWLLFLVNCGSLLVSLWVPLLLRWA